MPDSLGSAYRLYWRTGGRGQSDARQFGERVQTLLAGFTGGPAGRGQSDARQFGEYVQTLMAGRRGGSE